MTYVSPIENEEALIFDGPIVHGTGQNLLVSDDLRDIADCWELSMLPDKEAEWSELRNNAVNHLHRIEAHLAPDRRNILDFGCGWGFFLGAAKERGWKTYGIEPLPGHAVYARGKFGCTVVTDTLREDTFPPEAFDAITAFQVFEHVPDPHANLDKLCSMLARGGVMLIEVPNIDTWTVTALRNRHRHFALDHLNFFSAATLGDLLQRHKLRILESYKPTRRMTFRHLVDFWGKRVLPAGAMRAAQTVTKRLGVWDKAVSINLGDIVAVLAQKQGSGVTNASAPGTNGFAKHHA